MTKIEIFDIILNEVCHTCNVLPESVISGVKFQPIVDARYLTVQYLRRIGFSNDEIALTVMRKQRGDMNYRPSIEELKKKVKGVGKMFDAYSERCLQSVMFRIFSKDLTAFCRETFDEYSY